MARVLTSTHFHQVVGRHGVRSAKARKWTPTLTNRLLWLLTKLPLCPTLGHLAGGTGGRRARRLPCRPARHRSPPGPATPGVSLACPDPTSTRGAPAPPSPTAGVYVFVPLKSGNDTAQSRPFTPFIHPRPTLTQVRRPGCGQPGQRRPPAHSGLQPPYRSGCKAHQQQCHGTWLKRSPSLE